MTAKTTRREFVDSWRSGLRGLRGNDARACNASSRLRSFTFRSLVLASPPRNTAFAVIFVACSSSWLYSSFSFALIENNAIALQTSQNRAQRSDRPIGVGRLPLCAGGILVPALGR